MTTDEATERQQQKKPSQQEAEQHQAAPPDHGPSESQASSTPVTSPHSPGSSSSPQEEVQLRPHQRTSAGRGLSRLFSSFLKRRSQCEGDGGEKGEKGGDGEEAKAPIADCEPELRIEGDQNLDLHSLSSNEAQVRVYHSCYAVILGLCVVVGLGLTRACLIAVCVVEDS
uniref:Transmembrane protein n=1 Tax=Salmo trutta TaxID=8032 RepID=A0A674BKV1_SALTR